MKIYKNKKDVIRHALYETLMDFYLDKGEEVDHEAINIDLTYHPTPDRCGHFKINLYTAMQAWSTSDFKKFVEILNMSDEGSAAADLIHEFYSLTVKKLMKLKSLYDPKLDADIRKAIDTFVNKLVKMNDALSCYGIEKIEAETAPKYKKCQVYSMTVRGKRTVSCNEGYQFEKYGYIFQVYKRDGLNYIILPYVGLGAGSFKGNYRTAHEYIDENLLKIIKNPEKVEIINEARKDFIRLMSEEGYDVPEVCNDRSVFEPIETKEEAEESIKGEEKIKEKHIEDIKNESEKVNDSISIKSSEEKFEELSNKKAPEDISKNNSMELSEGIREEIQTCKPCKFVYMTFVYCYGRNIPKTFYRATTVKTGWLKRYANVLTFRFPLILASGPGPLKLKY